MPVWAVDGLYRVGMKSYLIVYEFSRAKVEALDFRHFLHVFDPEKFSSGRALRERMNALLLCVDGFDHDSPELYLIPQVRRFYAAFQRHWPYSLFFANLQNDWLKILAFCCLREITSITFDVSSRCGVEIDRIELAHWIGRGFAPMNSLCERAQMTERAIYNRSKAIFEYFDLPFDTLPPE